MKMLKNLLKKREANKKVILSTGVKLEHKARGNKIVIVINK